MSKNPRDKDFDGSWLSVLGIEVWVAVALAAIVIGTFLFLFRPMIASVVGPIDDSVGPWPTRVVMDGTPQLRFHCQFMVNGREIDWAWMAPSQDHLDHAATDAMSGTCTKDRPQGSLTMTLTCASGDRSATTSDPYGSVSTSCSP